MGPIPDRPDGIFAELGRWRDKAVKRAKLTHFNSGIIPDWLNAEIVAAQEAVGPEAAFSFLKQVPLSVRMKAEREIRRKVEKILAKYQGRAARAVRGGEEFDYTGMADELRAATLPELRKLAVDNALRLSVETGVSFDPAIINQQALQWAREFSGELVQGLTQTTRNQISEAMSAFVQTPGMTIGDVRSLIEPAFGPVRADMIASTEVTRAYAAATNEIQGLLRQEAPGLETVQVWNTMQDELVCPICGPLEGAPKSEWEAQFPQGPPAHPRCILPGNVVSVPGLVGGAQSFYVGGAIEVSTAGGRVLTVTLNHPILTRQGWVAAGLLSEGDHVVVCTAPEWIASSIYPDYNHMPAAIEQVFGALKMSEGMTSSRVPTAPEYLHGDGRNVYGYINVIGPNRLLLGNTESRLLEAIGKIGLDGDSVREGALSGLSVLDFLAPGDDAPARRFMSIGDLIRTALRGHLGPFEEFGLGLSTPGHVGVSQTARNDAPADTRLAREFVLGFASLIATDQIVNIRKFDFSGHVYDLQSGLYGLYTVNGVLASNCRCSSSIRFEGQEQLDTEFSERQAERERWLRDQGLWREQSREERREAERQGSS